MRTCKGPLPLVPEDQRLLWFREGLKAGGQGAVSPQVLETRPQHWPVPKSVFWDVASSLRHDCKVYDSEDKKTLL